MDKETEAQGKESQKGETAEQGLRLEDAMQMLTEKAPEIVEPEVKVEDAKAILEQIKAERKAWQEEMILAGRLKAEQVVSGRAEAGLPPPKQETEDERITRESNEFLKNTGYRVS